jgi:hypothetical protein
MENTHMPILKVTKKAVVALAALLSVTGCVSHSSAPKIAGEKTRAILNAQIASSFAADETGEAPVADGARAMRVLKAYREGAVIQPADVATTSEEGKTQRRGN